MFHYHGYRDVTITEVCEQRREMAKHLDLGYKVVHPNVVNAEQEKAVELKDETWGYDLIVDCTGMISF